MKKILLFIIAGVIGLGLTSCVQSEESESVIALRKAKADQLASFAALNNANAEAALILANAEAALKAAEAAYQESLAANQDSQSASLDAYTEAQILQNRLAEATLEAEIQAALMKAKAELAAQQAEYERQMAALRDALDAADDADRDRILALINESDAIMEKIRVVQNKIVSKNASLVAAQNGILTLETQKKRVEYENNREIAINNATIESLGKIEESPRAQLEDILAQLYPMQSQLWEEYNFSVTDYYISCMEPIAIKEEAIDDNIFNYIAQGSFSDLGVPFVIDDVFGSLDLTKCFEDSITIYLFNCGLYESDGSYVNPDFKAYGLDTVELNAIKEVIVSRELFLAKRDLDTAQARCDRYLDSGAHPDGDYIRGLIQAVDTAYAHWNKTPSQATKDEIEYAEATLELYKNSCLAYVVPFQDAVDLVNEKIAFLDDIKSYYLGEEYATYLESIASYLDIMDEIEVMFEEVNDKYMDYYMVWQQIYILRELIDGSTDVAAEIALLEDDNKQLQSEIDAYTKTITSQEAFIDSLIADIDDLEANLDVLMAQYDAVRAQIEKLMGE